MTRSRALLGASCLSLLLLAGCSGEETVARDEPTASSSAPSTAPAESPGTPSGSPTAVPTWDCDEVVSTAIEHAREPDGHPTPEEAALSWSEAPQGVETAPGEGDSSVALVDPATGTIVAEASVVKGSRGWYVDGWTTCSS